MSETLAGAANKKEYNMVKQSLIDQYITTYKKVFQEINRGTEDPVIRLISALFTLDIIRKDQELYKERCKKAAQEARKIIQKRLRE